MRRVNCKLEFRFFIFQTFILWNYLMLVFIGHSNNSKNQVDKVEGSNEDNKKEVDEKYLSVCS